MKRMRPKITFANVVSSIALFVAIGGGTAFATGALPANSVGSEQIRNYAVITPKLANSSVTNAKLAPSSVTGSKIGEGAVGSGRLATGAVTNSKIAAGAVDSTSVADGSLTTADLAVKPFVTSEVALGNHFINTKLHTYCGLYREIELDVDAPAPGKVVVDANVVLKLNHQAGNEDHMYVGLSENPGACESRGGEAAVYSVPAELPNFAHGEITLPTARTFEVGPGPHTFFVTGYTNREDIAEFAYTGITATYIPN